MRPMNRASLSSPRTLIALEGLTAVATLAYGASYLWVAVQRILYPYDLDFIEDNILMQAVRVSLDQPVYLAPNADFVPQVYMPLYTWLGGELFKITGPGYLPLRLLSFGATMLTTILIFWISLRIGGGKGISCFAAGLFLAGYHTTGGWYELARVDALFVALMLSGAALAFHGNGSRSTLAFSGITLALAFLTKQNGLFFAIVIVLYLWFAKKQAWIFTLAFLMIAAIPLLWLNQRYGEWLWFYMYKIAYIGPIDLRRVPMTLKNDLSVSMAGLMILFGVAAVSLLRRDRWRSLLAQPWTWSIAAALVISIAGRASVGGNRNNLMPAYTFLCLAPALVAREARLWRADFQVWMRRGLLILILIQFALTSFIPRYPAGFIPTASMNEAGDRLIREIARVPGPVLVLMHPYYAVLAGKQAGADFQMLWLARLRGREPLPDDLVSRIQTRYYSEIISDGTSPFETDPALVALLGKYYTLSTTLPPDESPRTLTGVIVRPKQVYIPNH